MRGEEERWPEVYGPMAEVYASFSGAEDAEGRVLERLLSVADFAGRRVLEIGVGTGRYTRALGGLAASYRAIDVSRELLALARERLAGANVELLEADMLAIPLPDGDVDRIFASWAYPAHGAEEKSHAEALRVLARGGEIWLVVNALDGAFMEMRGPEVLASEAALHVWYREHEFDIASTVDTEFVFPSVAEARRVLGAIFGAKAHSWLDRHRSPRLGHRVVIMVARPGEPASAPRGPQGS